MVYMVPLRERGKGQRDKRKERQGGMEGDSEHKWERYGHREASAGEGGKEGH